MFRQIVLIITSFAAVSALAQDTRKWPQVWADEFDAPANTPPDPAKWIYDLGGGGWGNQELEVYSSTAANVFHDGAGHLVIRARRTEAGGYTSARLKTLGKFATTYGKIEARIKIPFGQGIWPAFWMLGADIDAVGWPKSGEIDIMENIGKEPGIVHGTVHGPSYSGGAAIGHSFELPAGQHFSDDFHVYGITWLPERISFQVDGKSYFEITPASLPGSAQWVFGHPFFLLLNVAVGGSWPGIPDSMTVFPQEMLIDWVRVSEAPRNSQRPRP